MGEARRISRAGLLALVAPALLVAVALVQGYRVHTLDQSAWSGVGFAMFSRFEAHHTRAARFFVIRDGQTVERAAPRELEQAVLETKVVPTDAAARELALRAYRLWNQDDGVESVTVRIRGVDLEPHPLRFEAVTLATGAAP